MNPVATYMSKDKFHLADRGTVYCVENDRACNSFSWLIDHHVSIDGTIYKVKGVESFAIPHKRKGMPIGILVYPPTESAL